MPDVARMNIAEIEALVEEAFPQARDFCTIEHLDDEVIRLRLPISERHLRPGGTVAGPALMTLADIAVYFLLLSQIGPLPLAVTTQLNIHFLRKPLPVDVLAEARLLKLGKRLAVGEVALSSDGNVSPVAHATVTYSIPAY